MAHFYSLLDVFTNTVLAGNPLAVVFGADDIATERMQAIAREFNLSETVFVLRPRDRVNTARLRIFTPVGELPFAGHPTIGAAVALALQSDTTLFNLEEDVGLITCTVSRDGRQQGDAKFSLPRLPEALDIAVDKDALAAAVGLTPDDIVGGVHAPSAWSAGVPYLAVRVTGRAALDRAVPNPVLWADVFPQAGIPVDAYLYCDEPVYPSRSHATRMFAPTSGIPEDPATGSAAAILPAHLLAAGALPDGETALILEQGVKMGRPSTIHLKVRVAMGALTQIEIGGSAVLVAHGTINV